MSFGKGCARPGFPGVYTRLATFRSFIYSTIGVAPPGPATNLRVGTNTTAPVWDAPASDGGRLVTSYEVALFRGPHEVGRAILPPTARTTRFGGLANGLRFRFSVTASNVAEAGPTAVYEPPPFLVSIRRPVVRRSAKGITTVAVRLRSEPQARFTITVLNARGGTMAVVGARSRIAGRRVGVRGGAIVGTGGSASAQAATVAFRTPVAGQTLRILVTAANEIGERARAVVKARVLPSPRARGRPAGYSAKSN